MSKDINPESIWIFSALDKLMGNHKNNPPVFCQLFEKKKLMIGLLQEKKIDAKKYMKIVGKGIKDPDPLVVSCATGDTMKLKDSKDEDMINQWFKEMVDNTGAFYENQENLYKKYKNTGKPSQIKPVEVQKTEPIKVQPKKVNPPQPESTVKTSLIGGINPDEIVSFKVIDNLLDQNDENKQAFERYLQRKRKLLQLVNSNSLTADKYKTIILSFKQKSKNQEIVDDMQFQLDGIEDFHDGNVNAWFKDIVKETKDSFKDQEKHLSDLQKGKAVKKSKEIEVTLDDDDKVKNSTPVDLKEVNTFKAIDDLLMVEEQNKVNYKILLDKKKNLLDLKKKGALTAEKYKSMLEKALTQVKNQQIKESIEMELTLIDDMHDGKLKDWFEDVISSAEMFLEDQVNKLAELEKAGTSKKKVVEEEELIDEEEETHDMKKKPSNKAENATSGTKALIDFKEIYSLKAIDQYMEEYMKTPELFCLCFERKLAIFQMMKNGEINPQKYKDLQVKAFKQTKNEKLKDIIEMDLLDLQEMSNNDVNNWFESLINDSGDKYQEQEAFYKKWSKKPQTLQVAQNKEPSNISSSISVSKQTNSMVKIDEKPIINDVVCFTAIVKLFIYAVERVDIVYYKQLEIKRGKLIDLTSQKKLVAGKYREINKAAASKTTNVFLKNTILEEQARLNKEFKGNEQAWFQSLVTVLNAAPPELKLPQNKEIRRLNNSPTPKKADFFLRRMAIHECLFFFFKRSKIPIQTNKYLQEYERSKRKEVYHCLEMIHKDPSLDVYNLATQMFPDITSDIFYGDNLIGLKKRAESYIPALMKEIAALKDYTSKIKRSSNVQNIQTAKKEIAKCQESIAYLKSWPSGAMIPFPTITEEKKEKYNMDLNSKLDKNDLEVCITGLAGLPKETIMKIYVVNLDKQRYSGKVNNGPSNVHFVAKLSEKEIFQVVKGEKRHLVIRFFKEGFFGGLTLIGQSDIETGFTRSNTIQQRKKIGEYEISYVLKVNKPMRPLITQIMHVEVVQHPKYTHDPKVQQQVIKKYLMYSSPTPSEIFVVEP